MPKKLLIVEDEDILLKSLAAEFGDEKDIEVLTAKNGEEGLRLALDQHPHLILADLLMPKLDGIKMITKIREDNWGKDVKIFILTNVDTLESVEKAVGNHVYDFMIKANWKLEGIKKKVKAELAYIKL